jgi:hypothetical protein
MALYRFRVTFEDYDDVMRVIDVKANQTFEDLHRAIHQSTGYNSDYPSSFYISNDQWTKGEEITFMPNQRRTDRGVSLMAKVKLSSFIDDPHQKFYYTFNFDRPFDFHVELMNIILNDTPGTTYPAVIKSVGEAPKQFGNVIIPVATAADADDLEFLDEEEGFEPEEVDDLTEVADDEGLETDTEVAQGADDEEEDEFGSEFSDNEGFDEDGKGHHDDY